MSRKRRTNPTEPPTPVVAAELQKAYQFFNDRLFEGVLPACLITLQRERLTFGYFSRNRFVRYDGNEICHEIAMNPSYFATRSIKDSLATLVHEAVHCLQAEIGIPGRHGYHNKEWVAMMEATGLIPSDTGAEGGKKVGDKVSHYILKGGRFDRAADDLLDEHFVLSWLDRFPMAVPQGMFIPSEYQAPTDEELSEPLVPGLLSEETSPDQEEEVASVAAGLSVPVKVDVVSLTKPDPREMPEAQFRGAAGRIAWPTDRAGKATRCKYRCPQCHAQVWGKSDLDIRCGRCHGVQYEISAESRPYGAGRLSKSGSSEGADAAGG